MTSKPGASVARRLGPYEFIGRLGAGGMGEVHRARDTRLGREVAIKLLPPEVSADADRLRRFEKEARAASSLNHPNIVTIHEVERIDSTSFIVMELVEGKTLRELVSDALPVRRLLGIAVQIAEGLARAHSAGIVHRDLKPENVMVTKEGLVKILDFGLAKLAHPDLEGGQQAEAPTVSAGTSPGVVMGTVGYMSPEQASGHPVDFRSDQFSFGSLLYEMATGKGPFRRATAAQTLAAIIQDEPEPVAAVNPKVPAPLRWIIERCLAKEARERYASTEDVARDLASLRDHLSEASVSGISAVVVDRRVVRLWQIPAALLLLAAAVFVSFRAGEGQSSKRVPTFQRLTFRRGKIETARFAPDGQTIVYSAAWDGASSEIFSTRAGSPEGRSLGLPPAVLFSISDAGEVALGLLPCCAGKLARVPLGGGVPREILEQVEVADWSPGGKSLAVAREVRGTDRLEFPIGKVLYESHGYITHVRVSPKGDLVAFLDHPTAAPSGSVVIIRSNGKRKELSSGWTGLWGLAWSPVAKEIWFSARDPATPYALHGVRLSGAHRLIARVPGSFVLHDVFRDGRVLMARTDITAHSVGVTADAPEEHDLSWLDRAVVRDLSLDGKTLLYEELGEGAGAEGAVYVRKTDGSPAVRLGDGSAMTLSPDGKWALALHGSPREILLLPLGAGETKVLPRGGVEFPLFGFINWFPDGKRILFEGREPGHRRRCYVQDIDGGLPRPISGEPVSCELPSPDGKFVVAGNPRETELFLLPVAGGALRPIPGLSEMDEEAFQWSEDGRWLYVGNLHKGLPVKVYRLNVSSGRRELWKEFRPLDSGGVESLESVRLTRDGKTYVYSYQRELSTLYLVEGLK